MQDSVNQLLEFGASLDTNLAKSVQNFLKICETESRR